MGPRELGPLKTAVLGRGRRTQAGARGGPASPPRWACKLKRHLATALRVFGAVLMASAAAGAAAASGADLRFPPRSPAAGTGAFDGVPTIEVAAVDPASLAADDAARGVRAPRPLRVAVLAEVSATPQRDGGWRELDADGRLWRLQVCAPGATDLALGFARFRLPAGASLHVIGREGMFQGPYTGRGSGEEGELWTAAVPGERAVLELFLPADAPFEPELELRWVARGYRDLFGRETAKQGACHVDVACPEGDPWRDEIRSVVRFSYVDGPYQYHCSGTLIRDVPRSLTPYILSSAHCLTDPGLDHSVVVYWNFESPSCGRLDGGSLLDNQTGAVFRAARPEADFLLLELEEMPDARFGVFYSGWDARAGIEPQGGVGIHHPAAEEKAISINTDPATTVGSITVVDEQGNVMVRIPSPWRIDSWELGATEPGSSGSALWDADSHRVIGQLSGGNGNCSDRGSDYYAKFANGWDGEDAASRLRDWLDPANTGVVFTDGTDPQDDGGFGSGEFSYLLPAIVHSPGVGGSLWRSTVAALNPSAAAVEATFTYFWSDGPTTAAKTVRKRLLDGGSLATWEDAALELFGVGRRSAGSVLVRSTGPLVLSARTYTESSEGTYGGFMPGIATSAGVGVGELGVLTQLVGSSRFRTNVGLVNMSAEACEARVELRSASGATIGSPQDVSLAGYAFRQIDDVFAASGAGGQASAYATVEALSSGCRVWAYASVIDGSTSMPGTNDPTTVPLSRLD